MNEKDIGVEGFYQTVAEVLECDGHIYQKFPYAYKTRWNNRLPGNGRYPGHGIVRHYSADNILVQLRNPVLTGCFTSAEAALDAIRQANRYAAPTS